ncbi:TlpA disulfide reductase family protein [Pedobacter sp. Hv1]|uniref:TlpA family protein disulfide reductase n=1 Tax=Pedobacter sp. Hv1 TaxID=1740090 RepID=UPI0006D8C01E|nr:TlpA disulfide reductase family protein [Pedobacter sp. Hv1]KQC01816.1 hypothetical protein AQF98_05480 [Pedobacter sp. Hv1]
MKKLTIIFLLFIIALSTVNAQIDKQSVPMVADIPTIVAGTAKLTGRIISPNKTGKDSIFVNITVPNPISGEFVKYKALVDQSGKFSIVVEMETDIILVHLNTTLNSEKPLLVKLTSGGITNIDISYNSGDDIKNIVVTPAMNQNDMTRSFGLIGEMIEFRPDRAPKRLYDKSYDEFLNHAKVSLSERLEILNKDTLISKELKEMLAKDFHLWLYIAHVFNYEETMIGNYRNTSDDKSGKPNIQKIDRTYFRFLKDFKLNDPQYLRCLTLLEFQKAILQNETLGLPLIGENDIPSWLASVKVILSDLVGFDNGLYYDILAANAYGRQLTEEIRPLTEKQKEHITNYWKNGEIAKILFRKNQQVVELNKFKSPAVVNDISAVPNDKIIETILAKHQNKVVLIDLWATWCGPCLNAMQEFRSTKNELRDKDIVFVYLTNGSSPRKLWEEKIKGIGDEHYYLTAAQWEYIMDHFGFEAIPSYLLFNKERVLKNKFTAFPGNLEVKAMIKSLL